MPSRSTSFADILTILLAITCGVESLILFVIRPLGALSILNTRWSESGILCWDALLSLVFFLQHSGMQRQRFRTWLSTLVASRYHGAIYGVASGVALTLVVGFWQTSNSQVLVLGGLGRWVAHAISLMAFGLFVWSTLALLSFDPLGLRPITAHLRNRQYAPSPLVIRGPYRLVRHPLYSCAIVMIWTDALVTSDRLLFDILWTAWIVVGAHLEERDLTGEFGEGYREYQRRVPMLVPWLQSRRARWIPA